MIVAGMTASGVKAAIGNNVKTIIDEDSSAFIEYSSSDDQLTRKELNDLVNKKFSDNGSSVKVKVEGNESDILGTGSKINLDNGSSLTLVVYGDVTGDATVDNRDALKVLGGDLSDIEKKAADINDTGDVADNRDGLAILQFHTDVRSPLVDPSKLASDNISSSIGAKVKVEPSYSGNNGLWAVEPNASSTDVTLKVEGISEDTADDTVSFNLIDIPEGATLTPGSDDVKVSETINGSAKVDVAKKVGTYTVTLKSGDTTQTISIHVIDVSIIKKDNLAFEDIQDEDRNALSGDIKDNTIEVYGDKGENHDNKPEISGSIATFKGNVNTMKGGKLYRVRLKISNTDSNDIIIAYVKDDKVVRIKPSFVEGASTKTILFDLDASVAVTKLVVAPSEAVDAQIIAEINKGSGNFATVNFESTSVLWIDNEDGKGAIASPRVPTSLNGDKSIIDNQKVDGGAFASVSVDENDQRLIHVGAKLENVKKFELDENTFKEKDNGSNKQAWLSIELKVIMRKNNANVTNTQIECIDGDVVVDNGKVKETQVPNTYNSTKIQVWFKADKAGDIPFTLQYKNGDTVETLPLTIRLHDASDVEITDVKAIDTNNNAILNAKATVNPDGNSAVTFDTYKYAMSSSIGEDDKISRPYTLEFTTNVPIDSIKTLAKDATGDEASDWIDIATKTGPNTFKMTFDADNDNTIDSITLVNEYGKVIEGIPDEDAQKEISIEATEKSVTELESTFAVGSSKLKTSPTIGTLTDVEVKENVNGNLLSDVLSKLQEVDTTMKNKETLGNNVEKSIAIDGKMKREYDEKTDKRTVKIELNSKDFGEIEVNGEVGKWMLIHFACRGNINKIKDLNEDTKSIYVDAVNADGLLSETLMAEGTTNSTNTSNQKEQLYRVPVWINLSSDKVKAAIDKGEVIEVKFESKSPVEEQNSFYLKITDKNEIDDTGNVEKPKTPDVDSSKLGGSENVSENKKITERFFSPTEGTSDDTAKKLVENAEKIKNIEVTANEDLIYVKVTHKGFNLVTEHDIIVPLTLDISPLKNVRGNLKFSTTGLENNWNDFFEKDHTNTTADFGLYLKKENIVNDKDGHYVKNLYIGKTESSTGCDSVLHYVIEFVKE